MINSPQPPEWVGANFDYEGSTLALRARPGVDTEEHEKRFPHLPTLTHQLEQVRADGTPEPEYNQSLAEFDDAVHDTLKLSGRGLVMIVETFGGKRSYYACVAESEFAEQWAEQVSGRFSECCVSAEIDCDQAWNFYRQYRREYQW